MASFNRVFAQQPGAERGEPAIVLVVAPPGDRGYFDRLVEVAAQYRNEIFLILISDEIAASDYKRLVRTGGADWASAKAGPAEVTEIIARRQQQVRTPDATAVRPDDSHQSVTISFVPSAGGVGNTTLALETAVYLKTNKTDASNARFASLILIFRRATFVITSTVSHGCVSRNFPAFRKDWTIICSNLSQLAIAVGSMYLPRRVRNSHPTTLTSMLWTPSST